MRFFALGLIKDHLCVPPPLNDLLEFRQRMEEAIASIIPDLLTKVQEELDFLGHN